MSEENVPGAPSSWLRAQFEQATVPQAFCDTSGVLIAVNDAFCSLVGHSSRQLVGHRLSDLSHRADDGTADLWLAHLLAGEQPPGPANRVLRQADGRPVQVQVQVTLLRDADGDPVGLATSLRDVSTLHTLDRRLQQQEEFFLAVAQTASDLVTVVDSAGRVLYVSPAWEELLGYKTEDLISVQGLKFVHPDHLLAVREMFDRVVSRGGRETLVLRLRDGTGAWRWMEQTTTNLLDAAVGGVVIHLHDITEHVEAAETLRESEARYRAIADTALEGIWVSTPEGTTLYANPRMAEILGITLDELLELPDGAELEDPQARWMLMRLSANAARGAERFDVAYQHPEGTRRSLWVAATPLYRANGELEGSLAMVSDITESRRLEQDLRHAALHDSLTALPNRTLLLDNLVHALSREKTSTAVLFIDLDHFQILNDSRGHSVGDKLLVAVAERLRAIARPLDTVARFGGDEFLVIREDLDEAAALTFAEGVLAELSAPYTVDEQTRHTSVSIGVAVSPVQSAEDLLRMAESAMYSAKAAGRRCVRMFDPTAAARTDERHSLSADLRDALARDELTMDYQPIVDLRSGRVVGVEALARWDHPTLGAIAPDRFVTLAEETGLAPELDRWALRRAIPEAGSLRADGFLPPAAYVAVNLSARNLSLGGLEALAADCTQSAGLVPHDVVLEITETTIMDNPDAAIALLRRLRQRGFQVAVDDFGTGHSSISALQKLPITMLKIDRSFVSGIIENREASAIVASIVDLADAIGVTAVAEGVETAAQVTLLRSLGCTKGQGWLWCPAIAPHLARSSSALLRRYDVDPA